MDIRSGMGGIGALCRYCWECSAWHWCRQGPRAEKHPAAKEICRLKWNWFFMIMLASLDIINYSSPLPSFHQFITNPTVQQLNGTGRENRIEPGLGLSESFYHSAVSAFSIGEFLGAVIGGITTGRVPFWYSAMGALLCHIVGFIMYATSVSGWMIIVARILSGTFVGLQVVVSFTYFGMSYQHYLEVLGPEDRKHEEAKTTRVKDILFGLYVMAANFGALFGPGFTALIAQFHVDHFRSVAWFNVVLGVGYIFLQLATFHGETKCHCRNLRQNCKCSLPERSRLRRMMTCSNVSLVLIVGFLIVARGVISSKFIVYEELFNPILSDSFGFTVKQTAYFFLLLLPAHVAGAFVMLLLQRLRMNSRTITIFGMVSSMIGLILMSDWQSIPPDPCTDFSLYYHPELANGLSNGSVNPCLSGCQGSSNVSSSVRVPSALDNQFVAESFLPYAELTESVTQIQGVHQAVNSDVYKAAMNVCESLGHSQYQCHWIPKSTVTGTFCEACPAICRGTSHTLNFIQFTIGAFIFRVTIPIPRIGIMIVISDVVSKNYQSIAIGLAYASTGVFRSVTPLYVGAVYEGAKKRTFLAMSIVIATQIPILLVLGLLYRKLGRLKEHQMHEGTTEPLPTSHDSSSSKIGNEDEYSEGDEYSDEDTPEMAELLHAAPKKIPLEGTV